MRLINKRLLAVGFSVTFLLEGILAARAEPFAVRPAVWAADTVAGAEIGVLNCVVPVDDTDRRRFCVMAHATLDSADEVVVTIATFSRPEYDLAHPAGAVRTEEPDIVITQLPADSLKITDEFDIRLRGEVAAIGAVDVSFTPATWPPSRWQPGCVIHPLAYNLHSVGMEPNITRAQGAVGMLGSVPVHGELDQCGAVWFGPVTGGWALPAASFT